MTFNEVMALIMPSIIAVLFYTKITKKNLTLFDALCNSALFMVITNCICYAILFYLLERPLLLFSNIFTFKYCILATFIALITAILYRFVEINMTIKLKVDSVDEKN